MAHIRRKNGDIKEVFDGNTGQLIEPTFARPAPDDIPSIVERYIGLVGNLVADFETKAREKTLGSRDVNAIVALGRTMAAFQAIELARKGRAGGKSIDELPTATLRQLVGRSSDDESSSNE